MKKEKISLPIGNNKALVFEADPGNKEDQDFAKQCKNVAATQPQTIQDFLSGSMRCNRNDLLKSTKREAGRFKEE